MAILTIQQSISVEGRIIVVVVKVEGEKKEHNVFLYTLSTCGWCKKTKEFPGEYATYQAVRKFEKKSD